MYKNNQSLVLLVAMADIKVFEILFFGFKVVTVTIGNLTFQHVLHIMFPLRRAYTNQSFIIGSKAVIVAGIFFGSYVAWSCWKQLNRT